MGSVQGSPCEGWICTITFFLFPLKSIRYLLNEIKAFIFRPHGWPTKARTELDPSSRSMISRSNFVVIPYMFMLIFFHTPIGSISSWSANFRYIPNSLSLSLPICSHVFHVIIFTWDSKSRTTCWTWYPFISRSTSGSTSLLSFFI